MAFLKNEWSNDKYTSMLERKVVYITVKSECFKIEASEDLKTVICTEIHELLTDQEEADTRMFLHAKHVSDSGHNTIVIKSSDTDVEVLAVYYQSQIHAKLVLLAGTSIQRHIISISDVCDKLGERVCKALPGLHAIIVSAFAGKEKGRHLI